MKQLITKSDGTPTKSKIYAVKFLKDKGISEDCLIQENGQFFYEVDSSVAPLPQNDEGVKEEAPHVEVNIPNEECSLLPLFTPVTWETPVFTGQDRTELIIPGTDIKAVIIAKHPAGQSSPVSKFEITIGEENFLMSLDLVSKLFKVGG